MKEIFNLGSLDSYSDEVKEQISIEAHYKGYLKKQDSEILSLKKDEKIKIPENIKIRSEQEQIKQTKKTYCFLSPCSITKIFWAPIAKIKLSPVIKPNTRYSI